MRNLIPGKLYCFSGSPVEMYSKFYGLDFLNKEDPWLFIEYATTLVKSPTGLQLVEIKYLYKDQIGCFVLTKDQFKQIQEVCDDYR